MSDVDFDEWFDRGSCTLREASYLICGFDPNAENDVFPPPPNDPDQVLGLVARIYNRVIADAEAGFLNLRPALEPGPLWERRVTTSELIRWIYDRQIEVSADLLETIKAQIAKRLGKTDETFAVYRQMSEWTIWEAANLIVGIAPPEDRTQEAMKIPNKTQIQTARSILYREFKTVTTTQMQKLFGSIPAKEGPNPDFRVSPRDAIAFAKSLGFDVAPELADLPEQSTKPLRLQSKFEDHVSKKLAALNEAAHKFWGSPNIRKDDSSTYPRHDEIEAWLVKQSGAGFSVSLAEKGASIIRPDWVREGRPAEKG